MTRLHVNTAHPYDVLVEAGAHAELSALLPDDVARVAIVHPRVLSARAAEIAATLGQHIEVHFIEVPDGESAKSADVLQFCWGILGDGGFTRSDVVVGLGGGATTDLAGFVAATWLRGVGFVNLSTTVLGMVDAAIGGKTGIDTRHGKNLVGAFHEPLGVLCDLDALTTLPEVEIRAGMAEVIKCGFIADPRILGLVDDYPTHQILAPRSEVLARLIELGIQVKADTVAVDLHERGVGGIGREALNYGHTLGHAIERITGYTIRHGEAISIGMVYAAEIAQRAGLIDAHLVARHRDALGSIGLPVSWSGDFDELLDAMRLDKKTRGATLRFVVLDKLGSPSILAGPDESLLRDAFDALR